MSTNMSNDQNIPADTAAHNETVASEEEIYLEETEEELRVILTSQVTKQRRSMPNENNYPCLAENTDEQLDHAAEELITGDSDDPPLSEEAVVEILRRTSNARRTSFLATSDPQGGDF
jgi:hypothetical protein